MKKTLATLLCVSMLSAIPLSGCGGEGTGSTASLAGSTPASNNSSASGTNASGEPATWDTADLSWKKDTSPVTFDCYIDFDWYALDTWGKDDVSKEITARTGVSLNVTKSSDLNQLQVLLAADELPELIFTSNQVQRFFNPDIAYSFDELINQHCPEFMQVLDPVEIINNTQEDGHFYTLRTHYNSAEAWEDPRNLPSPGDSGLYVRQDIMDAIGNPKLASVEDLTSILGTVKEKYPDMVTYLPHPTWGNPICEYFGFTSPTSKFVDTDGQVKIDLLHPNFKAWMAYMNQLARKGYMSTEAYTYRPEQFFQIVRGGAVFCASYNTGLADETNRLYFEPNNIPGKFVSVKTALTHDGKDDFAPLDANIGWASLLISKKCKNPERAIRYMEFLKSPEGDSLAQWGVEGKHYTLTEDGLLKRPDDFAEKKATETGVGPWYFMASGLGEGVAVMSGKVSLPDYTEGIELLEFRKTRYVRNPVLAFTVPDPDSDEMIIQNKITELWTNSQVGILSASDDAAFDAAFQSFMDNCKTIGIEKLTANYTEKYNKAKAKYDEAGIKF